jgi:hypothetical protein
MPLFDHFHPPLYPNHHWESFHSNWATRIADGIAALLPADFQVEEHTHAGAGFEIDVAAFQNQDAAEDLGSAGPVLATLVKSTYAPPVPDRTIPAVFSDTFEVRVFSTTAGLTLVRVSSNWSVPATRTALRNTLPLRRSAPAISLRV